MSEYVGGIAAFSGGVGFIARRAARPFSHSAAVSNACTFAHWRRGAWVRTGAGRVDPRSHVFDWVHALTASKSTGGVASIQPANSADESAGCGLMPRLLQEERLGRPKRRGRFAVRWQPAAVRVDRLGDRRVSEHPADVVEDRPGRLRRTCGARGPVTTTCPRREAAMDRPRPRRRPILAPPLGCTTPARSDVPRFVTTESSCSAPNEDTEALIVEHLSPMAVGTELDLPPAG
jgi:hypothetical protein